MVGNMSLDPRGRGRQLLEEDGTDKGLFGYSICIGFEAFLYNKNNFVLKTNSKEL